VGGRSAGVAAGGHRKAARRPLPRPRRRANVASAKSGRMDVTVTRSERANVTGILSTSSGATFARSQLEQGRATPAGTLRGSAHALPRRRVSVRERTYVWVMQTAWTPRRQGDEGELSAMLWLASQGASVFIPVGHTPADYDLIADFGAGVVRVQVKTSTCWRRGRWDVTLCTRGGNQSWNGLVKLLDTTRCDAVFVHAGDGRRWYIPVSVLGGTSCIRLGGPRYADYEVEPGGPLLARNGPVLPQVSSPLRR